MSPNKATLELPADLACARSGVPGPFVRVLMRATVQKGAKHGEGKEAYAQADCELAAAS